MAYTLNPLDPKYAPGAEQARQDVMVGVSIGLTSLGVICVACRVYTRAFIVRKIGTEDWTMVAAAALTIAYLVELIVGAKIFKLGFSILSTTPEQTIGGIQLILGIVVTYKMIVTLIKISILMLYIRLAFSRGFETLCKATIAILVAYQVAFVIIVPAQCTPLEKLWDFSGQVQGHCINANVFYHVTSVFHILMDIWILTLPVKLILHIPRPPREMYALLVIFALGIISMAASIVRLQALRIFTFSDDPQYDALPINTWSMVEVNIGILCASIPTLKPLITKFRRQRVRIADGRDVEFDAGNLDTGKDMVISLHPATVRENRGSIHEQWELDDRPPPPPPKDVRFQTSRTGNAFRKP